MSWDEVDAIVTSNAYRRPTLIWDLVCNGRRNAQTHRLDIMISVCPWSYTTQLEVCDDVPKVLLLPWACECAYMAESECVSVYGCGCCCVSCGGCVALSCPQPAVWFTGPKGPAALSIDSPQVEEERWREEQTSLRQPHGPRQNRPMCMSPLSSVLLSQPRPTKLKCNRWNVYHFCYKHRRLS